MTDSTLHATAPPPADLQVRSLTIADGAGLPRIRLAVDDKQVAHIDMWGPNRRPILTLYAGGAGGTVGRVGAAFVVWR